MTDEEITALIRSGESDRVERNDVRQLTIDGCAIAVIVVHPASSPPVRYDGRIMVRVGPTTRVATPEEEQRLSERRRAAHLPFDVQAITAASLQDLDLVRSGRTTCRMPWRRRSSRRTTASWCNSSRRSGW